MSVIHYQKKITNGSVCQSISASLCQCISVSVYQCVSVSVCQSISVSVYQCVSVSVYQCVSVSVFQCITVSVYQCFSVSVCQCISTTNWYRYCQLNSRSVTDAEFQTLLKNCEKRLLRSFVMSVCPSIRFFSVRMEQTGAH